MEYAYYFDNVHKALWTLGKIYSNNLCRFCCRSWGPPD